MKLSNCGNVIRFPIEVRLQAASRVRAAAAGTGAHTAEIAILPCVRIERHGDSARSVARRRERPCEA
jgi:hypothetical protein